MNLPPNDLLVIGCGNPWRGDDGVGPYAARVFRRRGFAALEVHQLTPELAEPLSRAAFAVFIDADARLAPGQIRAEPVEESGSGVLDHHASPGALLQLARQVYGRAPQAVLIGIGAESYDPGRPLSSAVLHAVAALMERPLPIPFDRALAYNQV